MTFLIELALSGIDWFGSRLAPIVVGLAILSFAWLVIPPRAASLAAVAIFASATVLLMRGFDELQVAMLLIGLNALLTRIEASYVRRRLRRLDRSFASTLEAIRNLELAQERWQAFVARKASAEQIAATLDGKRPSPEGSKSSETAAPPDTVGARLRKSG
jgi:hypothetical protein